ncbi:hypothetical protein REPUB_Repub02eG0108600 [Reevesia pubescens]
MSAFTEFNNGNEKEAKEESKSDGEVRVRVRIEKYKVCEESKVDYISCLDNEEAIKLFSESEKGEKYRGIVLLNIKCWIVCFRGRKGTRVLYHGLRVVMRWVAKKLNVKYIREELGMN